MCPSIVNLCVHLCPFMRSAINLPQKRVCPPIYPSQSVHENTQIFVAKTIYLNQRDTEKKNDLLKKKAHIFDANFWLGYVKLI